MESLFVVIGQAVRNAAILADDVVVLAKPALAQMDDIVALAKPAVTQSSGVVIDDAAVGAGMIGESQIAQHREYRVWGKIAAGSMINKTILSGVFLVLSAVAPIVPQILLGLGGAYLTYEGAHKVHMYMHKKPAHAQQADDDSESGIAEAIGRWSTRKGPLGALSRFLGVDEKERTVVAELLTLDTILATEILLVAMGTVASPTTASLAAMLGVVSLATTALVYVPILGIMRSDNLAAWLEGRGQQDSMATRAGASLRRAIPKVLKTLGVVGTIAMLEVGGGILAHKIPSAVATIAGERAGHAVHAAVAAVEHAFAFIPAIGGLLGGLAVGGVFGAAMIGAAYTAHKVKAAWNKSAKQESDKDASCGCGCACAQQASAPAQPPAPLVAPATAIGAAAAVSSTTSVTTVSPDAQPAVPEEPQHPTSGPQRPVTKAQP